MARSCDALCSALQRVLDPRAEIFEAYLFGSQARGDATDASDVDVAVFVDAARAKAEGFGYDAVLADELAVAVGRRVDLVVLNHASPLLDHRVLRDGIRLLSRDLKATTTREGRALSRYCDFVPHLAKIDATWAARARNGGVGR